MVSTTRTGRLSEMTSHVRKTKRGRGGERDKGRVILNQVFSFIVLNNVTRLYYIHHDAD